MPEASRLAAWNVFKAELQSDQAFHRQTLAQLQGEQQRRRMPLVHALEEYHEVAWGLVEDHLQSCCPIFTFKHTGAIPAGLPALLGSWEERARKPALTVLWFNATTVGVVSGSKSDWALNLVTAALQGAPRDTCAIILHPNRASMTPADARKRMMGSQKQDVKPDEDSEQDDDADNLADVDLTDVQYQLESKYRERERGLRVIPFTIAFDPKMVYGQRAGQHLAFMAVAPKKHLCIASRGPIRCTLITLFMGYQASLCTFHRVFVSVAASVMDAAWQVLPQHPDNIFNKCKIAQRRIVHNVPVLPREKMYKPMKAKKELPPRGVHFTDVQEFKQAVPRSDPLARFAMLPHMSPCSSGYCCQSALDPVTAAPPCRWPEGKHQATTAWRPTTKKRCMTELASLPPDSLPSHKACSENPMYSQTLCIDSASLIRDGTPAFTLCIKPPQRTQNLAAKLAISAETLWSNQKNATSCFCTCVHVPIGYTCAQRIHHAISVGLETCDHYLYGPIKEMAQPHALDTTSPKLSPPFPPQAPSSTTPWACCAACRGRRPRQCCDGRHG